MHEKKVERLALVSYKEQADIFGHPPLWLAQKALACDDERALALVVPYESGDTEVWCAKAGMPYSPIEPSRCPMALPFAGKIRIDWKESEGVFIVSSREKLGGLAPRLPGYVFPENFCWASCEYVPEGILVQWQHMTEFEGGIFTGFLARRIVVPDYFSAHQLVSELRGSLPAGLVDVRKD